jgi:hypothetical protein
MPPSQPDAAINRIPAEKDIKRQPGKVSRSKNHFHQRVALHCLPDFQLYAATAILDDIN